jgi:hydrogenase-4 component F
MRIPAIFLLALALTLGLYFPEPLRTLLDSIIFELGYL